ncbi:MAG: AAA family ATPase, partial [Alteromonas sp.]
LLISLLARGHCLLTGIPGLGKTLLVKTLANCLTLGFKRIQFTPDLMPTDVLGTEVVDEDPNGGKLSFRFVPGPIFSQVVLADEINRAPAKVQSALLEAMAERQITVGNKTYKLSDLFLVMATQNPLEQEGTYPLPEAQLDRFLMHVEITYPNAESELEILRLTRNEAKKNAKVVAPTITQSTIFAARQDVLSLHLATTLEEYIVQLIMATRSPVTYSQELGAAIEFGASPRATISLERCARAHAWLAGRDFVGPDDIQAVYHNVMRHRIILSYEAMAEGKSANQILTQILTAVPVP